MKLTKSSFFVDPKAIDKITDAFEKEDEKINKFLKETMKDVVDIVYDTARAPRRKIMKNGRLVSDPNDIFGVPVVTGNLRNSIRKEVEVKGKKVEGVVYTDCPYASKIEFGDSKNQQPRPFMAQSVLVNLSLIKDRFAKKYNAGR